ncbi:MAG: hypothetical protein QOH43_4736, partial [Solirubrobacteraceae bacterium]|nr:hypothetical protein [Solirubrobacteraceae bacterium]
AEGAAKKPRRRRRGGRSGGAKPEGAPAGEGGGPPRRAGGAQRRPREQRQPREKGPLPFNELRDAARSIMQVQGSRKALRDAFGELADKERGQLSELVSGDGDFRVRARSISAGSLAAGKLGKALAAQQVAIADVEDLWSICLSKEEAAERQARVRNAKRRDEQRAARQAERANRDDRISKEDREKARDGRVGAQIRFVIQGEEKERAKKGEQPKRKTTANDLLDRLGY